MSHSIEIWREVGPMGYEPMMALAPSDDLPTQQGSADLIVELCRRYPRLSRELAEYLAR